MKYLVMECHFSYAVVLDENGTFLKAANRHYQVGQMVTDVIPMQFPEQNRVQAHRKKHTWVSAFTGMAACLTVMIASAFHISQMQYASVYMAINPEVRIDVNRREKVVDVEGINTDGEMLLEDYRYKRKDLDLVMDELVDRAIDMGYLHEGGRVTLTLEAKDDEWVLSHKDTLSSHLDEYLEEKISVTVEVTGWAADDYQVTVPLTPEAAYHESDYGVMEDKEPDYEEPVGIPL